MSYALIRLEERSVTAHPPQDFDGTGHAAGAWKNSQGTDLTADRFLRAALGIGLLLIICSIAEGTVLRPLLRVLQTDRWWGEMVRPGMVCGIAGLLLMLLRTLLWFRYQPYSPAGFSDAPSLTVIIPAYNEGPMVQQAISSVLAAQYPRDRLEVLVVDDGSTDDTWHYVRAAGMHHPGVVTALRFSANRGKRAALETGFRRARGDVVVTIDSDSVIEPETLLAIAGPFRDPRIGAVAGKVLVYNRLQGCIPRMLQVRYVLSFDFLRAVQSTYRTVYCCPGALSAYRTSAVRHVLQRWAGQMFLGTRCTYGEDRALTNYILSIGYDTVYQRTAKVYTVVPWTYKKLCRMYLRWDRSYIREVLRFAGILWRRPAWARAVSLFDVIVTNLRYPVSWAGLVSLATLLPSSPGAVVPVLYGIGVYSCLNALFYLYSERSWQFVYGVLYAYFSFLTLVWIFPYAACTLRSRNWGTR